METVEITIQRRTAGRKGAARKLRSAGHVPAVLYGPKRPAAHVSVEALQFERRLAQQMTYCLRALGVLETRGKRGNAIVHRRLETPRSS